jgi:Protein of unknown function (DUF2938)
MPWLPDITRIVLIGAGATAVMDVWLWLLNRWGVPTGSFALIGRWVGHMARGRFAHAAIAKAPPIRAELGLGWLTHYAVGIVYAGLLIGIAGVEWVRHPSLPPALVLGVGTVVAPWFVMQPAMGAGFVASKTPTPLMNCLRSIVNHAVFGVGLYLSASLIVLATA